MKNWMRELALHYNRARASYPEDKLIILFDIDGTILDMRHMVLRVLKSFDRCNRTSFFRYLELRDIKVHENQIEELLSELKIPVVEIPRILRWYKDHRWLREVIFESHRPFAGVMEVMRWFQIQPNTYVGLNTARPESLRVDTLRSLNELGKEYKIRFSDEQLFMSPFDWDRGVQEAKKRGITTFQNAGYRVVAFIDNEPANLSAVSTMDAENEIMLLHADTIFETVRARLPRGSVRGRIYDITELAEEKTLPRHVQFVWHGINDEQNLRQFLASGVQWGEVDVRFDADGNRLILRHDSVGQDDLVRIDRFLLLEDVLEAIERFGKSMKFDLKASDAAADRLIEALKSRQFDESRLWFNGDIEVLGEFWFRRLAAEFPAATIQCRIDFLTPLILGLPEKARELLGVFAGWGVTRFSIRWDNPGMRRAMDQLDLWGFEVNIYGVPDLESFLKAVLLLPRSITSDFNFPKWHYFGRGPGEGGQHHEYSLRRGRTLQPA